MFTEAFICTNKWNLESSFKVLLHVMPGVYPLLNIFLSYY